ncbi:hypothetical protein [Candidatus Viadribacter manganicus]|uniref:Uncharacterized protein n=1 Tax=Candidatus Viadribacter manganicus TaxID=1759059 RepID=A0A1B1AKI8_9PROT|nr:hypothetical protein [Candidatus Viadribacter manganicus]ANP47030.1 hypothetical protein ATE48_14450 [Candidatus Viadribacter manganicus]
MKNFLMSAMALTAVLVLPGVASADDVSDRNQAISICRAEVQAQAGADATVRLDQVRVRPRAVRVELDLWRNGQLQNVRCEVTRGHELTIAAISPTVQTASLAQ